MAIEDNRINTFLKNANELLIHPLRDSLVKGNTLAQEDDGDNHDSVNTQKVASLNNDTDTKGVSTIIDKIVATTSLQATLLQFHQCWSINYIPVVNVGLDIDGKVILSYTDYQNMKV